MGSYSDAFMQMLWSEGIYEGSEEWSALAEIAAAWGEESVGEQSIAWHKRDLQDRALEYLGWNGLPSVAAALARGAAL